MLYPDMFKVFTCKMEIEYNSTVKVQTIQAPAIMIQNEFMAVVEEVARATYPVRVKLSREVPVYSQFDRDWLERECSIEFRNNAYISAYGEAV
ncbi:hypothetical protein [Intestinimonas butyriciproducens]|uniref:hypothetical protein n=1 Tax=Intestinimonas butyriciproducens TaxID=1297617 RepID=UPI001898A75F|nr:hypothetical protein [Intestinimonas butyriciproducens]MDB7829212.1 hypothetical protein [Intestinimonas butyriciproducens]